MLLPTTESAAEAITEAAWPITETADAYDPLFDLIGDAQIVLVGEASHGSEEFYQQRALLTRQLIEKRGFTAVAAEADWPDAYLINRYVRGRGDAAKPLDALAGFKRFPQWMWRNFVVLDFIQWMREYNDSLPEDSTKAGFYGLDLYSLQSSIQEVLAYLDQVDPDAAARARFRYSCFDHTGEDPQAYGYAATFDLSESCERNVIQQLVDLRKNAKRYMEHNDGRLAADEYFFAEQNALVVKNAEFYYRTMFTGRVKSWNVRDRHMAETLWRLIDHLNRQDGPAKIVVWAHNSHIGDARATEMGRAGELNLGQLVRERHERECRLIGFSTYSGTVTAADNWDDPPKTKYVRPALSESYEALFHGLRLPRFGIGLAPDGQESLLHLDWPRLERAIGVIYRPETERMSHYFEARLRSQFDAVLHFDQTRALEPLDKTPPPDQSEPETYPTAV